ncbi:MAG: efflux RND transporter periplasmic adaptor subunit [Proteobacteria bacterium]|nr:efflux RND transporter periplasmic adaptor subunit [Pseudomonadota bacterium]
MSDQLPARIIARPKTGLAALIEKPRSRKLAIFAVLLALSSVVPMELTISGEFEVYPEHNADIRAPVEAVIAEIFVKEGDAVEAGDMLFQLSNPDHEAKRQDIRAQLAAAQARLDLLVEGTRSEEINLAASEVETAQSRLSHARTMLREAEVMRDQKTSQARQAVALAKDQLDFAEADRDRYQKLLEGGIIAQQKFSEIDQIARIRRGALADSQAGLNMALADDLGEARREASAAAGALRESRARLDLLHAGSRGEEIEAAKSAVENLEAQLALVEDELASMAVRSPERGIVMTEHLHDLLGQLVHRGDLMAEVYDFRVVRAELLIPEKEIGAVAVGQTIRLKARAYPGRAFEGQVVAIAPRAIDSTDGLSRKMIRVTTEIANPDLALKPAMTGQGKIYAGNRSILNLMTRRFVRYFRVEFWSWW